MQVPFLDLKAPYLELSEEFDAAYQRVMNSGWYIMGNEVSEFERKFSEYLGGGSCVGVSNGLDALALILAAYGIGPGDEVIVPAHTFIATWLAVSRVGALPVPVDISATDFNMNASLVEAAITSRTKAIMPVHLYGQAADMSSIMAVARKYGLKVIEDAAQSHGATLDGAKAGAMGDAAAFSFYPGKNLGAYGDAGAVFSRDPELIGKVRKIANYGSRIKYQHEELGCNARMDDLQAALLLIKLKKLDEWNDRRRRIASRYAAEFAGLTQLTLPRTLPGREHVWHLFVVMHPDRDGFKARLEENGVQTLIHYPLLPHASEAYRELAIEGKAFPVAENVCRTVLSLPIGPHLSDSQIDKVIDAVKKAV